MDQTDVDDESSTSEADSYPPAKVDYSKLVGEAEMQMLEAIFREAEVAADEETSNASHVNMPLSPEPGATNQVQSSSKETVLKLRVPRDLPDLNELPPEEPPDEILSHRESLVYECADCGTDVKLSYLDAIRCRECGYRILYKKRNGGAARTLEGGELPSGNPASPKYARSQSCDWPSFPICCCNGKVFCSFKKLCCC